MAPPLSEMPRSELNRRLRSSHHDAPEGSPGDSANRAAKARRAVSTISSPGRDTLYPAGSAGNANFTPDRQHAPISSPRRARSRSEHRRIHSTEAAAVMAPAPRPPADSSYYASSSMRSSEPESIPAASMSMSRRRVVPPSTPQHPSVWPEASGSTSLHRHSPHPRPTMSAHRPFPTEAAQPVRHSRPDFEALSRSSALDMISSLQSPASDIMSFFAAQEFELFNAEELSAKELTMDAKTHEDISRLLKMPDIEIPPEERAVTPRQMSCRLMEHQKVALKWLKDQENNKHKRGGLLADTMGLGKTIEALALMLDHKPPQPGPKTTLIVAPLALLRQWEREITSKVKPAHQLSTFIYHGPSKTSRNAARLFDFDVVLTTYGTVSSDYNNHQKPTARLFRGGRGFYRIILDEAHRIKNRNSLCSKAVTALQAQYRLCMTGTPFMNNTAEIFSLIRFLNIAPYNNWPRFSHDIDRPLRGSDEDEQARAMQKLQVLFRSITLRRTKDSLLDGQPIIKLPEKSESTAIAVFDEDQRGFYDALEKKQQIRFNKYIKRGRLSKVYTFILVLLLRLRQACGHPFLIKNHGIPDEAELNGKQMIQLALKLDPKMVARIEKKTEFQCPLCDEIAETPMIIYPCGHDICSDCFSAMMMVTNGAGKDQNRLALSAAHGLGYGEVDTSCPQEGCDMQVLPKKVLCHSFFLDAFGLESGSQGGDASDEELEEECDEDEEDSDDDSLASFIVDDECEGDEDEDEGEGEDELDEDNSDIERESQVGESADESDFKGKLKLSVDRAADTFPTREAKKEEPGPDGLSQSEVKKEKSQKMKSQGDMGPEEDIWAYIRRRHEAGWNVEEHVDTDSDLSLPSLKDMGGSSSTRKTDMPQTDSVKPSMSKRKRVSDIEPPSKPNKRVKKEDEDDSEKEFAIQDQRKKSKGKAKATMPGKSKKKSKKKTKGKTLGELRKKAVTGQAAKARYFERLRQDFVSSAKINTTLELLQSIRKTKPGEKTLVFSLWPSFLDLLEIPMQECGFRYLRYDGSMPSRERDDNVKEFHENPSENILLVSLLAGNAGLNLTAASQVIILEPFWNPFIEDQAVDRAHRIGQKRRVEVHRVLVAGTVEDRILELQEKKRSLVNAALSEEGAIGAGRLSVGELKGLFGIR